MSVLVMWNVISCPWIVMFEATTADCTTLKHWIVSPILNAFHHVWHYFIVWSLQLKKNIDNQAPYAGFSDAKCNKVPANCYVWNRYRWLHNSKT
jgi:hypothetical protein